MKYPASSNIYTPSFATVLRLVARAVIILIAILLVPPLVFADEAKSAAPIKADNAAEVVLRRTEAEVNALITKQGRTPPKWWNSVKLEYPKTLDLMDTVKVKGWKPKVKLGAYMISVVAPNPSKWRGSIKLWHHVLNVRKNDPQKLRDAMRQLARAYFNYEQDYARAAFWWLKSSPRYAGTIVRLAKCYWKLGNKTMARKLLALFKDDPMRNSELIRLYDEMGDRRKALGLFIAKTRTRNADAAWLVGGDIWRRAGDYDKAVRCYQKVLDLQEGGRGLKGNKQRAQRALDATRPLTTFKISELKDGVYSDSSRGYRGPVEVEVEIAGGKIISVEVIQSREDMAFTSLTEVPKHILKNQGLAGVDAITGATISSNAVMEAAAKALAKGAR